MVPMEKLAGTKWGAHMEILTQVYTAAVRPHMEYASDAWSSAARTNLDQLTKPQNTGLRITTGGMKATPISGAERTVGLLLLEIKRKEKLLPQSEKMKRLPTRLLHSNFEVPPRTDSRDRAQTTWSKRFSRNTGPPHQHATNHMKCFWRAETPTILLDIPGIQAKEHHTHD